MDASSGASSVRPRCEAERGAGEGGRVLGDGRERDAGQAGNVAVVVAFGLGTVKGADRAGNVSVDFGCATGVKMMPACTPELVKL